MHHRPHRAASVDAGADADACAGVDDGVVPGADTEVPVVPPLTHYGPETGCLAHAVTCQLGQTLSWRREIRPRMDVDG